MGFFPDVSLVATASGGARRFAAGGWALVLSVLCHVSVLAETKPPSDAHRHWAFHPPREVTPPPVRDTAWPSTAIDRFILAKLEAAGLPPAPPADPRTLIRRMSFDLTGLPPTDEEVHQFVVAAETDRPAAVDQLIERLLASPHYGECWGRHWLDVARYSDTKGYVYAREERRFVHAPGYRDWVIRAFNDDLPYDRFLLLQMAADQVVPDGSPDLAAMGFVTGGRRFLGVIHDIIDDRIDVVTRGTLGLTVACARCHDHKYDPIPTRDYYSLYGVFHGADDRLVPLASSPDAELAEKRRKFTDTLSLRREEANARLRARAGEYLAAQLELKNYPEEEFGQLLSADDLIPYSVRRWRDFLHQTQAVPHPILAPWQALRSLEVTSELEFNKASTAALASVLGQTNLNPRIAREFARPVSSVRDAAARYGQVFKEVDDQWKAAVAAAEEGKKPRPEGLADPAVEAVRRFLYDPAGPCVVPDTGMVSTEFAYPTTVTEELWKLQGEVDRRLIQIGVPTALVLAGRAPEPNPRVFLRGRASAQGDEVPRQFLEVIAGPNRKPFLQGSGRLELARAIASADNPLTARVMVNRLWQHHFGVGLVKTPSDFGLRAEPPSHPELLDWLARRFVAEGWSVKGIHRMILRSAVYQQSSVTSRSVVSKSVISVSEWAPSPADLLITDSLITDHSRPNDPDNRLLSHFPTRRLNFEQIRDAMLSGSGQLDLSMGGVPGELLDEGNTRRTVYALVDRQFLPGTFRTFDFANPDLHVAVRHETTVPQQALFFLNGTFAADCARTLARRVTGASPQERIQHLYHAMYQRDATAAEVASGLHFIAAAEADRPAEPTPTRASQWRYGTGNYDEKTGRVNAFAALTHFTGSAWQGAAALPGGESGWAQITAVGGHPGNTRALACIRRWVAPRDATVSVTGTFQHEPEQGDGVRAFVVSSRHGELSKAVVHQSKADLSAAQVAMKAGDTLDFIVDIRDTLSYDQFLWAPLITADGATWDAKADFGGPAPSLVLLAPWEQYAQVLLLANEFAFVD